jgi:hypothetical protein
MNVGHGGSQFTNFIKNDVMIKNRGLKDKTKEREKNKVPEKQLSEGG